MKPKKLEPPNYCPDCKTNEYVTITEKQQPHQTLDYICFCHQCKKLWETDNPERK